MRRLVATLSGLSLVLSGTGAAARTLPNYDALQDAKPSSRLSAGFKAGSVQDSRIAHMDEVRGVPTFVWAERDTNNKSLFSPYARMSPDEAARAQVQSQIQQHAKAYGFASVEQASARVTNVSENDQGVKVVTFAQSVNGIEVFRQSLNALLDANNELVALSGSLSPHVSSGSDLGRYRFRLSAQDAIGTAYGDLVGAPLDGSLLTQVNTKRATGAYKHFQLATYARPLDEGLRIPARAKQVLFPLPDSVVPAYYVELNTARAGGTDSDYYSYVVSAIDGRVLMRTNLTADASFTYRVYADTTPPYTPHDGPAGNSATPYPSGTPNGFKAPYEAPVLLTLQNAPFSKNDPWLPDGATVTTGNNADAYADLTEPDGYNTGDIRPSVTAPGVFDRTYLHDIQPDANDEQRAAATTQLFFMNNWLHDWFYDSGFDEAAGNAQASNFGRGGEENDPILAEAQDYSGTNNANMSTPADGASPRMQMYRFSGPRNARVTATAPANVAGDYASGVAAGMGPQTFDITGDVVFADDGVAPGVDACTALANGADVTGKIAFIDRGTCTFDIKVANAQAAGAVGVIIADNQPGFTTDVGGTSAAITIPVLRVTQVQGTTLRAAVPGLNVRMFRGGTINLDGTIDNVIIAHEWGHYISNRLVANAAGLSNQQGRSMGEGWGDFNALLMITRPEDINVPTNANWTGAYGAAEYATRGSSPDSGWFGIRRVTYSADFSKNALTFKHISDGVALPTTTPLAPGGVNSEVHNSGEIWATMLWESYVSLLRAHPFQEAQARMKRYVVAGYKLTPPSPTYTEARDAVIAAAVAHDPQDGQRIWQAFARRGAGVGAVSPVRTSTNHAGVVESFDLGADVALVSVAYEDDAGAGVACDGDGILDNGETGRLRITVRNAGSEPAAATTATVFSSSPGVTVGNGGTLTFPTIPVAGKAELTIPVSLTSTTLKQTVAVSIALRDNRQVRPGDKVSSFSVLANYDEAPATTATEDVQSRQLPWVMEHDTALADGTFQIVDLGNFNRAFLGPDLGAASDVRLVTPPLEVGSDPFVLNFKHAWSFETDTSHTPNDYYDGAAIELSEDNGQTWVDVGSSLYTGTLYDDPVGYANNQNPLKGKPALVGRSAGFPALVAGKLDLGTTYAGKTVRLRFRTVSDNGSGNTGWVLDDLAFSGITNKPFTGIVKDDAVCAANRLPTVFAGPDQSATEGTYVTLLGSASDADGDTLTYQWSQVSGPAVTLEGADTKAPHFIAPAVTVDTDVELMLTVSDSKGTATDTLRVRVLETSRAPIANAGAAFSVKARSQGTLDGSGSTSMDGSALQYHWRQVSGPPVQLSDNGDTAKPTFTAPDVTTTTELVFELVVNDGKANSAPATVTVTVTPDNRAPVAVAKAIVSNDNKSVKLDGSASSDADGDTLTYKWEQTGGPAVNLNGGNQAVLNVDVPDTHGKFATFTFRLTVTDTKGASSTATIDATAKNNGNGGGCSATGAGANAGLMALALVALLGRRRRQN